MKTMRLSLALVSLAGLAVWLPAQPIQNLLVTRIHSTHQTDASTVVSASANPFSFQASIEGDGSATNSNPIDSATVTLPNSSTHALIFSGGHWRYDSSSYADATSLTAAYGDGSYTYTTTGSLAGTTNAITLNSIASSQMNTPTLTLTSAGGSWSGGVYNFVIGQDITVTFNQISPGGGGDTDTYHYDFDVNGSNTSHTEADSPNDFVSAGGTPPTFILHTSAFLSGSPYTMEVGYGDIQTFNSDIFGDASNYLGAGLFEIRSTITLQAVIPEPSTYAAILGVMALAGVMVHRHRRRRQLV